MSSEVDWSAFLASGLDATLPDIPVLRQVSAILLELEQWHHSEGQGHMPATLYVFLATEQGYNIRPHQLGQEVLEPYVELMTMTYAARDANRRPPHPSCPVAHVLIVEGWMYPAGPDAPWDAFNAWRGGRPVEDLPGRVEARMGAAVVEGEHYVWLARARGEQPTCHYITPDSQQPPCGRLFEGVMELHHATRAWHGKHGDE